MTTQDYAASAVLGPMSGAFLGSPVVSGSSAVPIAPCETIAGNASLLSTPAFGLNPLVTAAHPLLETAILLRQAVQPPMSLEALRAQLSDMVRAFVERCAGLDVETVAAARYCLCTFMDEVIAAMPWGAGGAWSTRSLLVTFHGEASGGERFFTVLHRLSQDPESNIDALELLHVILALGMQGRYRLIDGGAVALDELRERLRVLIRRRRGPSERSLSPRWRGVMDRRRPGLFPGLLWSVAAAAGTVLLVFWACLNLRLIEQRAPVLATLQAVHAATPSDTDSADSSGDPAASTADPAAIASASKFLPQLSALLSRDIASGRVSLSHGTDRATITLHTDGLFATGSARVGASWRPLMRRIGAALRKLPGRVVVTGHTDGEQPAPGTPSNWALSMSRATSVVELLRADTGQFDRFLIRGRGDSDPLASNDTAAGRARNRRVTITLLAPGQTP